MSQDPVRSVPSSTPRRLSRRRLLAASAAATLGTAALVRTLLAQSEPPPFGHNPFVQTRPVSAGPSGLVALLAHVPQVMLDEGSSGVHWYYADLAQQFDAVGVSRGEEGLDQENEQWLPAMMTLMTASNAFNYAQVPEFTDAIGFNPLGIGQTLLVGDPGKQLTLFQGGLRPADLVVAWERAGYTPELTSAGDSFHSIGTDGEISLDHPVQRSAMATMNNLALVGDTLVCAPTRALLEAAIAAGAGELSSATEHPVFGAALRTLPETTVSAIALSPDAVGDPGQITVGPGRSDDLVARSDAEIGPMPSWEGLLTAVAAGAVTSEDGGDAGLAMIRIVTGSADDAEAVTDVVEYRWNEGESLLTSLPYTELMQITDLAVDETVAMIDFEQLGSSRIWSQLFIARDTLPFNP